MGKKIVVLCLVSLFSAKLYASDSLEDHYANQEIINVSPVEKDGIPFKFDDIREAAAICKSLSFSRLVRFTEVELHRPSGSEYLKPINRNGVVVFQKRAINGGSNFSYLASVTCAR